MSKIAIRAFFIMFFIYASLFPMVPNPYYRFEMPDSLLEKCIRNPESSIDDVERLIRYGANPDKTCTIYDSMNRKRETNLYTFGVDEIGCSPNPWKSPYAGNKEVMGYIFAVLLERKLQKAIDKEKKMHAALLHDRDGISFVSRYWHD